MGFELGYTYLPLCLMGEHLTGKDCVRPCVCLPLAPHTGRTLKTSVRMQLGLPEQMLRQTVAYKVLREGWTHERQGGSSLGLRRSCIMMEAPQALASWVQSLGTGWLIPCWAEIALACYHSRRAALKGMAWV